MLFNGCSYHLAALERPWAGVSNFFRRSSKTGRERANQGGKHLKKRAATPHWREQCLSMYFTPRIEFVLDTSDILFEFEANG